jgi:hypothetical protein
MRLKSPHELAKAELQTALSIYEKLPKVKILVDFIHLRSLDVASSLSGLHVSTSEVRDVNLPFWLYPKVEYRVNTKAMTWEEHEAEASNWGGHLCSIHSAGENQTVRQLHPDASFWTGGRRKGNDNGPGADHWEWSDGSPWDYTCWGQGQPDNCQGHQDRVCVGWPQTTDETWDDDGRNGRKCGIYVRTTLEASKEKDGSGAVGNSRQALFDLLDVNRELKSLDSVLCVKDEHFTLIEEVVDLTLENKEHKPLENKEHRSELSDVSDIGSGVAQFRKLREFAFQCMKISEERGALWAGIEQVKQGNWADIVRKTCQMSNEMTAFDLTLRKWTKDLSGCPKAITEAKIQIFCEHMHSLVSCTHMQLCDESGDFEDDHELFIQAVSALTDESSFWSRHFENFPRSSLSKTLRIFSDEIEVIQAEISHMREKFALATQRRAEIEALKPQLNRVKEVVTKIDGPMSRIANFSLGQRMAALQGARDELEKCIDGIRDEFQERKSSNYLNRLKQQRTQLRRALILQETNFIKDMESTFPEGSERDLLLSADRELRSPALNLQKSEWSPLVDWLSGQIGHGLRQANALGQAETLVKREASQLEEWHASASGFGISILGKADNLRKSLKKARRARTRLVEDLEEARDDNDAKKITKLEIDLKMAGENVKDAQTRLDSGFQQAARDLLHFPEESSELAKLLDGPSSLLKFWKELSFTDFQVRKELFGGNHRVFKVQRGEADICTVLKQFPVRQGSRKEVNKEAAKMIDLKHPHTMPMLSIFFETAKNVSSVFIEMPYCAGGSIVEHVSGVQPGLARVSVILGQTLDALAYMHAKNVAHGDIKPANILMTTKSKMDSQPRVADFGLSRDGSTVTSVRGGGTQGFMAPELLSASNAAPTAASDMWAFGVLLQQVKDVLREADRNQSQDHGLDDLIQQLLVKSPSARCSAHDAKTHDFFTHTPVPEPESECVLCGDSVLDSKGIACAENHFVCDGCFDKQVRSLLGMIGFDAEQQADGGRRRVKTVKTDGSAVVGALQRAKGRIHCCYGCSSAPFSLGLVAKHVEPETFDALSKCRVEILQIELEKNNDKVIKEGVQRELDLLERMSEREKKVRAARKKIEGELLVLSCPNSPCNRTFTDWGDCGAVRCEDAEGNGCRTTFCCYCQQNLTALGGDPHRHVLDCPVAGPKPPGVESKLYPPQWFLDQVWAKEWKQKVAGFLETLEGGIRSDVVRSCRQSFRDLNISFPEFEQVTDFDDDVAESLMHFE